LKTKLLGILFTAMYLLAMLKPISPIIGYYINYDYIVDVLCENKDKPVLKCNGKCHLTKELKKANDGIAPKENIPPLNMKEYPVAFINNYNSINAIFYNTKTTQNFTKYNLEYYFQYLSEILKPPTF
jgi:hypothetical protein